MLELRKATPEERKIFYAEEWDKREIPDFILHTLSLREFGFDPDGSGPNQRYKQFTTPEQLADYLRRTAPYSVFSSVALYEDPSQRRGWLKAELAFDIDAKDLPIKPCSCTGGKVCERCLDEAKRVLMLISDVLSSNLGLRDQHFSYSGRGFHLRVLDEPVMRMEQNERTQLVAYVTGGVIPSDITLALGYSKVFREFAARTFERLDREKLGEVLTQRAVRKLIEKKDEVLGAIRNGRIEEIKNLGGRKSVEQLLGFLARLNSEFVDGKVTVDVKRILRLPSSLHSGVSMKCISIRNIEKFSLDEAVPKFVSERR